MDSTNNRIGSIRFDDETVLEVSQKGGGGAGVGGTGGLEARNLITGESTNEAIEDLTEDLEDAQETIETQAQTIEDQQAVIDAFPTIEALNVTANGTYNETGKAYKPVTVNVAGEQSVIVSVIPQNSTNSNIVVSTSQFLDSLNRVVNRANLIGPGNNEIIAYVLLRKTGVNNVAFRIVSDANGDLTLTNVSLGVTGHPASAGYSNLLIVNQSRDSIYFTIDVDFTKDVSSLTFTLS